MKASTNWLVMSSKEQLEFLKFAVDRGAITLKEEHALIRASLGMPALCGAAAPADCPDPGGRCELEDGHDTWHKFNGCEWAGRPKP